MMKYDSYNKLSILQEILNLNGTHKTERMIDDSAIQEKLLKAVEENRVLGRQLGLENMERLFAERALLKREQELLKESEAGPEIALSIWTDGAEMKENLQDMLKQKHEVDIIRKRYEEKCGPLDKE